MEVYRTPDSAFDDVPDFPWEPSYAEVTDPDGGTLRMAYVDAGPADGPVALLLHGEPSWSFLYRHVIVALVDRGIRCVTPDMVGFGRSDKPVETGDYSFARLVEWTRELAFDHLDLRDVTLVGQDWGGLVGLRVVAEHHDRFSRVVAANTGLPTGDFDMPEIWWQFRRAVETAPTLDVGRLVAAGCARPMSDDVRAAYDAPFPEERDKAGVRALPTLVPTRHDDPAAEANRAAWEVLSRSEVPFLVAFSDGDPITGAMAPILSASSSPAPAGSTTRPSAVPATSSRRTPARSWVRSSPASCSARARVSRTSPLRRARRVGRGRRWDTAAPDLLSADDVHTDEGGS